MLRQISLRCLGRPVQCPLAPTHRASSGEHPVALANVPAHPSYIQEGAARRCISTNLANPPYQEPDPGGARLLVHGRGRLGPIPGTLLAAPRARIGSVAAVCGRVAGVREICPASRVSNEA